jgi:hypothetical protein
VVDVAEDKVDAGKYYGLRDAIGEKEGIPKPHSAIKVFRCLLDGTTPVCGTEILDGVLPDETHFFFEIARLPELSAVEMAEAVHKVLLANKTHDTPQHVRMTVNRQPCVACGCMPSTCAHIIIASKDAVELGLNVDDISNFIPLCGSKGIKGTCHDAFDVGALAFYYSPAEKCWRTLMSTTYKDFIPSSKSSHTEWKELRGYSPK